MDFSMITENLKKNSPTKFILSLFNLLYKSLMYLPSLDLSTWYCLPFSMSAFNTILLQKNHFKRDELK